MPSLHDLPTPALVVDAEALEHNLAQMARALPGARLRPHVKAHKSTELARLQAEAGHRGFTCATLREMEGLAAAGLGEDLLLANEVLDARRLGRLDARVSVAIDSEATLLAARHGGVREVLVDVNVGLPRCGCAPDAAGRLAEQARAAGLEVRGVMGYEGHLMGVEDRAKRTAAVAESMALLAKAHAEVGGDDRAEEKAAEPRRWVRGEHEMPECDSPGRRERPGVPHLELGEEHARTVPGDPPAGRDRKPTPRRPG